MIIKYPTYYKNFKCIANDCTDTCCVDWQVIVDKDTACFYNTLNTEFGEKIRSKMYCDQDNDVVFENENNRCPFLNSNNLCDIYINVGEEHLCHTCTMFPRFYETFGATKEMGLSLSCPVANDLILNDTNFNFDTDFNEDLPEINDLDADEFMTLKSVRDKILSYIKTDAPLKVKLNTISSLAFTLKDVFVNKDFDKLEDFQIKNIENHLHFDFTVLTRLEYLTQEGKETFFNLNFNLENKYNQKFNNILFYYIYRYLLKSVYTNDFSETLLFAVFSVEVISSLFNINGDLSVASRLYSKEIEHSQNNLNSIKEYLSSIKNPH